MQMRHKKHMNPAILLPPPAFCKVMGQTMLCNLGIEIGLEAKLLFKPDIHRKRDGFHQPFHFSNTLRQKQFAETVKINNKK